MTPPKLMKTRLSPPSVVRCPMATVVLAILIISFVFFVGGWIRPDVTAMLVLASLVLTGAIDPSKVFLGFSSNAVITIAGLMVIGSAMEQTGVVKWVALRLERVIGKSRRRLLLANTAIPGMLSGFINIVAAAAFFIPVILRLCKKMKVPQTKVLMPMACTALIGANLTLIGASHNLVVHSLLKESQGKGFAFFEFTAVGAVLLVAALLYIFMIGQHLLPEGTSEPAPEEVPESTDLLAVYGLEDRIFELWLSESVDGLTLGDLPLEERGLTVLGAVRESEEFLFSGERIRLIEGDTLLVRGREEIALEIAEEREELTFLGAPHAQNEYPVSTAELSEAVVPPRSPVIGKTAGEIELLEEFGMTAVSVYREDRPRRTGAMDMKLKEGDSILLYGPRDRMREFAPEKELLIYFQPGRPEVAIAKKKWAPVAVGILAAVVVVAALGWFPIAVTAVAGAVLATLLGLVGVDDVYEAIDWRTLVLIAGMYPLGVALDTSGAADMVGQVLIGGLGGFGPVAVFAGLLVLTMTLTQAIHNAAVAVIMAPIAINAATMMESSPTGFCVGIVVACSAAFLLPYGHPAPLMVQKPGSYTNFDYFRFGFGLNVIALAVVLVMVPLMWPF